MPLILFLWMGLAFSALADGDGAYFKGPMATCLSRAKVVYPCVSFSPPSYQANSAIVTNIPIGPSLPLDADKHEGGWLAKLRDGEFWNPKGLISRATQGLDMNFSVVQPEGPGMNMHLGPMKLNMYVDENHFSDSQFFLGIDRSW